MSIELNSIQSRINYPKTSPFLFDKIKNSNSNTPISSSNNLSKPNFEQRRRSTQIPLQTDILLMNQPQNAYLPTGIQQSTSKNSSKNSAPTSDTSSQMIMSANNMNHTQNNSNNHENLSESKGDHMSTDMLTSSNSNSNLINSTSLIDPSLSMDKKSYSVENLNLLSNLKEAVGKNSEKSKNLDETELPLQNKSDRFEFNVRLGPEDITKKKSLSLLLLLEYLLDIIYHEDSVTSHVWKIKPNSGARSQDREIPLTDLFKSLMGRSNNNSSSRPMMFRRN